MVNKPYRLIPKAIQRVEGILHDLGLEPLDRNFTPAVAAKKHQRFYMTPVHYRGTVAWFKAGLESAPGLDRGLQHESLVQKSFADFEKKYRPGFHSPSFIKAGKRGPTRWLLRKYWQGDYAGDMVTSYGLTLDFMKRVSPLRMARIVADVQSMTSFMQRRSKLHRHDAGWYLLDFRYYRKHFFSKMLRHTLNPGLQSADVDRFEHHIANRQKFLKDHSRTFAHGDLYPNNIMLVGKKPDVVLFDWELAHWNLPGFDVVMLYLMAWQNPLWQKAFRRASLALLPRTPVTEQAWYLAMLSLSVRLSGFAFLRLTNGQPSRYPPLPAANRPIIRRLWRVMSKELIEADQWLSRHP